MPLPTYDFTVVDLPMGPGARAARQATIKAIFPKPSLKGNWKAAFQMTLAGWRSRIKTFRAKEVIKPKGYLKAANCAPWAFHVQSSGQHWRYCGNEFCPWCHMRKVDAVYQLVEKKFRAAQERNPDVFLSTMHKIRRLPVDTSESMVTFWALRMNREAITNSFAAGLDGLGALWQVTVSPGSKTYWQLTSRTLVLMDNNYPIICCRGWKREQIESFRPDALEPVIAAFLRYPVGYLRGKPDFAAQTLLFNDRLRTKRKLKFSGRSGVFRKE